MTTKQEFQHLKPYERPSNYCGATWYGYYNIADRHRDSDVLTNSNWDCWVAWLTELLGPEGRVIGEETEPQDKAFPGGGERDAIFSWVICRESHWAVGWIEVIRVHSSNDPAKLAQIDEKLHDLDGYPVFDEQHFSDAEQEEYMRCWEKYGAREDFIRAIRKSFTAERTEGEDYAEEDDLLDKLEEAPLDRLIELHESLIPSGEYYNTDCWPNTDLSVEAMQWEHIENVTNQEKTK